MAQVSAMIFEAATDAEAAPVPVAAVAAPVAAPAAYASSASSGSEIGLLGRLEVHTYISIYPSINIDISHLCVHIYLYL